MAACVEAAVQGLAQKGEGESPFCPASSTTASTPSTATAAAAAHAADRAAAALHSARSVYRHDIGYALLRASATLHHEGDLLRGTSLSNSSGTLSGPLALLSNARWFELATQRRFDELYALYRNMSSRSAAATLTVLRHAVNARRPELVVHILSSLPRDVLAAEMAHRYPGSSDSPFSLACELVCRAQRASTRAATADIAAALVGTGMVRAEELAGPDGATHLQAAAATGIPALVSSLLTQPGCTEAVVNQQDKRGWTPFSLVCCRANDMRRELTDEQRAGLVECARLIAATRLVRPGEGVGDTTRTIWRTTQASNLTWAVRAHAPDVVSLLLSQPDSTRAVVTSTSRAGDSSLSLAWTWAFEPCIGLTQAEEEGAMACMRVMGRAAQVDAAAWAGQGEIMDDWSLGRTVVRACQAGLPVLLQVLLQRRPDGAKLALQPQKYGRGWNDPPVNPLAVVCRAAGTGETAQERADARACVEVIITAAAGCSGSSALSATRWDHAEQAQAKSGEKEKDTSSLLSLSPVRVGFDDIALVLDSESGRNALSCSCLAWLAHAMCPAAMETLLAAQQRKGKDLLEVDAIKEEWARAVRRAGGAAKEPGSGEEKAEGGEGDAWDAGVGASDARLTEEERELAQRVLALLQEWQRARGEGAPAGAAGSAAGP